MSGFDPEWLALREPIDHRSRNRAVAEAALKHFDGRSAVNVIDLGCGTGSNFRALQGGLPPQQNWRLIDHDSVLLAVARDRLAASVVDSITTRSIQFVLADLAKDVEQLIEGPVDLVTAAALFDLVSNEWLARFAQVLAQRSLPLYAVLTYNGHTKWQPATSVDTEIMAEFHAHQRRDKGFGAAAGPQSAALLCEFLRAEGYHIMVGDSPWILTPTDSDLVDRLVSGIAAAVAETERLAPDTIDAWRRARFQFTSCEIGHIDVFAYRPGR
jgi:hypothetical protein